MYWQIGSSATLGTTSAFVGTIMALTSIFVNQGANIEGRALARNGEVTLNNNRIFFGGCATGGTTAGTTAGSTTGTTVGLIGGGLLGGPIVDLVSGGTSGNIAGNTAGDTTGGAITGGNATGGQCGRPGGPGPRRQAGRRARLVGQRA